SLGGPEEFTKTAQNGKYCGTLDHFLRIVRANVVARLLVFVLRTTDARIASVPALRGLYAQLQRPGQQDGESAQDARPAPRPDLSAGERDTQFGCGMKRSDRIRGDNSTASQGNG